MELEVMIPIRPILKKFVYFKTNTPPDEPVDLSLHDPTVYILEVLLGGKKHNTLRRDQTIPQSYSELISILIPKYKIDRFEYFLNESAIVKFNTFLYKLFLDDLHWFVLAKKSHKCSVHKAIDSFINLLEIEDLVDKKALLKAYYRMRKRKKISKVLLRKMSLALKPV